MSALIALAERVEAGSAEEQGRLLDEAWETLAEHSAKFRRFATSAPDHHGFNSNADKFSMALEAMAYESAAMMLVPEGLAWTLGQNVHHHYWSAGVTGIDEDGAPKAIGFAGPACAPALALTAAALRARAAGEGA